VDDEDEVLGLPEPVDDALEEPLDELLDDAPDDPEESEELDEVVAAASFFSAPVAAVVEAPEPLVEARESVL
jgi:hypothetical protein